jgi:hypothetical protein
VRRANQHHPCLAREDPVVAEEAFSEEEPVVLEALLRARGAEPGRRRVELDLQGSTPIYEFEVLPRITLQRIGSLSAKNTHPTR